MSKTCANLSLTLVRSSAYVGYCETNNANKRILCYGNIANFSKYTITHEFGHVFDDRSARTAQHSLTMYISDTTNAPILDNRGVIMGTFIDNSGNHNWRRGERGWGFGPGSVYQPNDDVNGNPIKPVFTQFQQHPQPYPDLTTGYSETAADMFLNWVYDAYVNKTWKPTDRDKTGSCNRQSGCDENSLLAPLPTTGTSGDARRSWMNTTMKAIFVAQKWK